MVAAGYGEQNLYTMYVTYTGSDGATRTTSADFGIRELAYASYPDGEARPPIIEPSLSTGQSVYMKGAGWCTIDAMMRFEREDYDRILSRARDAGINFLRARGGDCWKRRNFTICATSTAFASTGNRPAAGILKDTAHGCPARNHPAECQASA